MNDTQRGILSLIKSSVTGEKLRLPDGFSPEEADRLIRRQHLAPLIYPGAVNCGIDPSLPQMQTWFLQCCQALLVSERQMAALDRLFAAMNENGIDHLPLKGCNMKGLYPKPEMRPMGDADILISMDQFAKAEQLLASMGYTQKSDTDHTGNWICDDLYVELHKSLVPPEDADYYSYYGTGWRLAVKGEGSRWDLSDEDAFVFAFTHFARHYRYSGIGCRHVADLYVLRRCRPHMDQAYISRQLDALHLLEFYGNIMNLLDVWFEDAPLDDKTRFISAYIFSGGNWGKIQNFYLSEELKRASKKGSIKNTRKRSTLSALFPDLGQMRRLYPILHRFAVLLPVFWCVRWVEVLIKRPQNIKKRVSRVAFVSDEAVSDFERSLRYVGLPHRSQD